jgi:hypothetical protein
LPLFPAVVVFVVARAADRSRRINLPTSKSLTLPVPGYLARTNSFPATIASAPTAHYAALLNQGYGTQESGARQSIAILDLSNNQTARFSRRPPERRLLHAPKLFHRPRVFERRQHLYASMGSITDPTGEKPKSTGNGIAVYKFADGQVTPERFIKIRPSRSPKEKKSRSACARLPPEPRSVSRWIRGVAGRNGDRLLIANNLSDNVVLLDVELGQD